MSSISYLQSLGWSAEQLQFLGMLGGVCLFVATAFWWVVKARLRSQDREIQRLFEELRELHARWGDSCERACEVLSQGWTEKDPEVAAAALEILLDHLSEHPGSPAWRNLVSRVDKALRESVDGLEEAKLRELLAPVIQESIVRAVQDRQQPKELLEQAVRRVRAATLTQAAEQMSEQPPAGLVSIAKLALDDLTREWLQNQEDDDVRSFAQQLLVYLLTEQRKVLQADSELTQETLIRLKASVLGLIEDGESEEVQEEASRAVRSTARGLLQGLNTTGS